MRLSCYSKLTGMLAVGLLWVTGCTDSGPRPELASQPQSLTKIAHSGFAPSTVSILPLTRLVTPVSPDADSYIRAYVTLEDQFGDQLKYPGTFRFELYEKVLRSAEPKGKRKTIWPDLDLTRPEPNHRYWQRWLWAYEFHLDFVPDSNQKYILQVTFLEPEGKRLYGQATLEF